jgi:hypothetical protein
MHVRAAHAYLKLTMQCKSACVGTHMSLLIKWLEDNLISPIDRPAHESPKSYSNKWLEVDVR